MTAQTNETEEPLNVSSQEIQEPKSEPPFIATRNYTDYEEQGSWLFIARSSKDFKYYYQSYGCKTWLKDEISKQLFRCRRSNGGYIDFSTYLWRKALRARYRNSDDLGAFLKLTNSYFLVGGSEEETESFRKTIEGDVPEIPVISATLGSCNVIGCMCVGNKNGLIVPDTVYDTELQHLKEKLPDSVEIKRIEERSSALGNVVVCNDKIAIVHPDLDKESEEIIANTLQVEVFRHMIGSQSLVGSYCVLNNKGGLICPEISKRDLENLSSLLELTLETGTVNNGNKTIASGLVANDVIAYAGMKTTGTEFVPIERVLGLIRD